ncbi:DUF1330 domain-containing protein [Caulobacter sp.]|uniref:DUF1330 domain-containing protein n=1 Tax=Caulobacter sp. TaxID=78 RepID=UPI002B4A2B29|nr:DUF1330 domain-containing protein [Caulobacter sp.]HJV42714.1 DUF1330 domain-containing protein [Caulobacter sp.]
MTVYVVAQLRFIDPARYRLYQARFAEAFAGSGGQLLAADESPRVLEGEWPWSKLVLMAFPDEAAAQTFLDSPLYREISEHRRAGALTTALLVQGLDQPGR